MLWLQVLTELRNRGVRDVLIACCDGLEGLPAAIETVWPATVVQTLRGAPDPGLDAVRVLHRPQGPAELLRRVFTAPTGDAALDALGAFADSDVGRRYPGAVATWERAWEWFTGGGSRP